MERKQARLQSSLRLATLAGLAFMSLWSAGCAATWDEFTSRDFSFKEFMNPPPPLVVLRDSTDGDKRAKALRALTEPKQTGGTDADQDAVVKILVTAATQEKQPLCRLAAIQTLARFKDPRAVKGLTDAFYNASAFAPETTTVIRCEALTALGQTHNPAAVELLVRVVKEPPAEGPELDKQQTLEVRIAAARALGNFPQAPATEALVQVLRSEKDVALRDRAGESLHTITGKELPADAKAWEEFLYNENPPKNELAKINTPKPVDKPEVQKKSMFGDIIPVQKTSGQ